MLGKLKNIHPKYKKALIIPIVVSLIMNLVFGLFILTSLFIVYGLGGANGAILNIFISKIPGLVLNGVGYGLIIAIPIIVVMFAADQFKKPPKRL